MSVIFHSVTEKCLIPHKSLIKNWLKDIISEYNKIVGDINIILISDREIIEINKKYLKHDYFTDIITFNFNSDNIISGDLYISFDRVKENSKKYNTPLNEELSRVIIHGIFHLLGFDDKTKEQKNEIRILERKALDLILPSLIK